jgi:hypothetical protein
MTEAKRGRPSKYGDKDAKKVIKANAQKLLVKAEEVYKNDPAWGINVGVLQWVTANPDLVTEDSVPKVAKAFQDYPELRINLLYRADPDNSDLTNIMLDAALRAGIVKVLQDNLLEGNRGDAIPTARDEAKVKVREIAAGLLKKNNGVEPKGFIGKIQLAYAAATNKKEPDKRTIEKYLASEK